MPPARYERLYPGDVVFVIGTDEQLDQFKRHIEPINGAGTEVVAAKDTIVLKKLQVRKNSFLHRKTIRESGIREMTQGLVVGLERKNRRNLNPESNIILEDGDVLWIVGNARLIDKLAQ